MDPGPLRDALTALAGVGTGALSGLFGVGGAVISTPAIRALGASASIAIGTTLPAIIPGAASGTLRYRREGLIEWRAVVATAPAGVVMAVVGAVLADVVPGDGHLLMLLTAALLGLSAARMARTRPADPPAPESDAELADAGAPDRAAGGTGAALPDAGRDRPPASAGAYAAVGALAGLLSGLLGVGGGIVMVPGFTQLAGMPVKRAIGSSLACVAIFAVPGTITHAALGNIDWRFALLLAVGVVPGAQLGARLTIAADDRRLRVVVAAFLGAMALAYGVGELVALS